MEKLCEACAENKFWEIDIIIEVMVATLIIEIGGNSEFYLVVMFFLL